MLIYNEGELSDTQSRMMWTALLPRLRRLEENEKTKHTSVEPFAFYNGRERWIGFHIGDFGRADGLFVVFGENRNSDHLVVMWWHGKSSLNPPTVADVTEETYHGRRKYFDCHAFVEATTYVMDLVEQTLEKSEDA